MLTTAEYSNIIKEEWSDSFYEELRPALGVAELIQYRYEGIIKAWGDTVKVQTISTPGRAQILTSDNEAYTTQVPTVTNQDLVINKRAVYPVDITDWADYQANPKHQAEIRGIQVHEIARAVDQTILDTISSDAENSGNAAMTKALIAEAGRVLDKNNVPDDGSRIMIMDPQYKEDLVQVNEILSRDFIPTSSVFMSGKLKDPIYGFKVFISNLLPADTAYFWHPSFMQVAVQKGAEYKEIDLESATNVPSMRVRGMNLFGLKQFDNKRVYKIYNT